MIESRYASSLGSGFSSAIFKPSLGRCWLIHAVTRFAIGSRSRASKAGRKNGSKRRSTWTRLVDRFATKSRNAEPVLAFGIGRSGFGLKALRSPEDYSKMRGRGNRGIFRGSTGLPRHLLVSQCRTKDFRICNELIDSP